MKMYLFALLCALLMTELEAKARYSGRSSYTPSTTYRRTTTSSSGYRPSYNSGYTSYSGGRSYAGQGYYSSKYGAAYYATYNPYNTYGHGVRYQGGGGSVLGFICCLPCIIICICIAICFKKGKSSEDDDDNF